MDSLEQRHAFVLRLWREGGLHWRGWIQHVGSREQVYVRNVQDLVAFIEQQTAFAENTAPQDSGGSKRLNQPKPNSSIVRR